MIDLNIWQILKSLWPLWAILIIFAVIRIIFEALIPGLIDRWKSERRFKAGQKWRSDRDLLRWLRGMKPSEFEDYIAELFSNLGYKTEVTGGSYDEGIDVIAEKDGIKYYIQCKKFITSKVKVHDVRDFYGALADHLANGKGYFITTNSFTLEAEKFTEDKPIELINGFRLIEYIRLAEKNNKENKSKDCPKCGGRLEERAGKYGKFYGCSNYPKCKYTENIKK
jgi:restriction system protein